mgnify:CR=1 FL=1|jgi:hypothetical protein|tara:strand:- start:996 stop:1400 length:405 start_codon:yes stop_codon:yes gene_type:complete
MSKIQIITSIVGGILDDVTVRIGEKIVTDFEHLAFDWDVYEGEERASYQGNLEDCTEEEAKEHYNDLVLVHEFQYDGLGSTLAFAESLGFVDNSPSANEEGWNPDEADGLEDSAIEFIESKGYKIVGYPEEDQS